MHLPKKCVTSRADTIGHCMHVHPKDNYNKGQQSWSRHAPAKETHQWLTKIGHCMHLHLKGSHNNGRQNWSLHAPVKKLSNQGPTTLITACTCTQNEFTTRAGKIDHCMHLQKERSHQSPTQFGDCMHLHSKQTQNKSRLDDILRRKTKTVRAYLLHRETVPCKTLLCENNFVSAYLLHRNTLHFDIICWKLKSVSAYLLHREIVLCEAICRENKFREWVPVAPGDCTL